MPELPEVETVKRGLADLVVGQTIENLDLVFYKSLVPVAQPDLVAGSKAGELGHIPSALKTIVEEAINGAEVKDLSRRGKVLILELDNSYSLVIHLKMTGQLVFEKSKGNLRPNQNGGDSGQFGLDESKEEAKRALNGTQSVPSKSTGADDTASANSGGGVASSAGKQADAAKLARRFAGGHPTDSITNELPDSSTRLIFEFEGGDRLYFNDQRKFGWVKLVKSSKVKSEKLIANMGPEPFSKEFTAEYLKEQLKNRSVAIKAALLDQKVVAGVGNIYADEALHKAKIHPETPANELNGKQLERLVEAIPAVMQKSLDHGGTTFTNYVNANGETGDYLENARVYQREGEECRECGATIRKIKVANRGTHICPECQVKPSGYQS